MLRSTLTSHEKHDYYLCPLSCVVLPQPVSYQDLSQPDLTVKAWLSLLKSAPSQARVYLGRVIFSGPRTDIFTHFSNCWFPFCVLCVLNFLFRLHVGDKVVPAVSSVWSKISDDIFENVPQTKAEWIVSCLACWSKQQILTYFLKPGLSQGVSEERGEDWFVYLWSARWDAAPVFLSAGLPLVDMTHHQ